MLLVAPCNGSNTQTYSKTCLKWPLKKEDQNLVFMTDYPLMQVKSIAECSKGAFCNTFDLHYATICLSDLCFFYIINWLLKTGFTVVGNINSLWIM